MTADRVRADLEANLPLGSSPERVVSLLNARHYWNDRAPSVADLAPKVADRERFELQSIIRNTRTLFPVRYSITMRFEFNQERKLTNIKVDEVGTGP